MVVASVSPEPVWSPPDRILTRKNAHFLRVAAEKGCICPDRCAGDEQYEHGDLVPQLVPKRGELLFVVRIAFRVVRLLRFEHQEVVVAVPVMDDHIGKHRPGFGVVAADVVPHAEVQALRLVAIAIVLAVYVPPGEFSLQVFGQLVSDATLVGVDFEQVNVFSQQLLERANNGLFSGRNIEV